MPGRGCVAIGQACPEFTRYLLEARSIHIASVGDAPVRAHIAQTCVGVAQFGRECDQRLGVNHVVVGLAEGVDTERDSLDPRAVEQGALDRGPVLAVMPGHVVDSRWESRRAPERWSPGSSSG